MHFLSVDREDGEDENEDEEHGGASQSTIAIKTRAKLDLRCTARANSENV